MEAGSPSSRCHRLVPGDACGWLALPVSHMVFPSVGVRQEKGFYLLLFL